MNKSGQCHLTKIDLKLIFDILKYVNFLAVVYMRVEDFDDEKNHEMKWNPSTNITLLCDFLNGLGTALRNTGRIALYFNATNSNMRITIAVTCIFMVYVILPYDGLSGFQTSIDSPTVGCGQVINGLLYLYAIYDRFLATSY